MDPVSLVAIGFLTIALGIILGLIIPNRWHVRIFSLPVNISICSFWLLTIAGCLTVAAGVINALSFVW